MQVEARSGESIEHPAWCGAVSGYVGAALSGMIRREVVIPRFWGVILSLQRSGMLQHLGEVETYARATDMPLHIAAVPFEPTRMPGARCIDLATGEPRPYYPNALIGDGLDDNSLLVMQLCADQAVNIARLTHETGMQVIG